MQARCRLAQCRLNAVACKNVVHSSGPLPADWPNYFFGVVRDQ